MNCNLPHAVKALQSEWNTC